MELNNSIIIGDINKKLKDKPLVYFCREVERAISLENVLKNYHICCIENTPLVDRLIEKGFSVFCLEKVEKNIQTRQSSLLLDHPKVLNWLNKIGIKNGFFALTFKPNKSFEFKLIKIGGRLLACDTEIASTLENKIKIKSLLEKNNIQTPKSTVVLAEDLDFYRINKTLETKDNKLVVQLERGNTGAGTFFVENPDQFKIIQKSFRGNYLKVSEFIKSPTYTFNGFIGNSIKNSLINTIQMQITNINQLINENGVTLGNQFGIDIDENILEEINLINENLIKFLNGIGYRGLFGVDMMLKDNKPVIIEINARQTANLPFESQLTLEFTKMTPLNLLNIAHFLGLSYENIKNLDLNNEFPKVFQLFLRSDKENLLIKNPVDFKTIKDYDLDFDELKLSKNKSNLLTPQINSVKNKFEEITRIQSFGDINDNLVKEKFVNLLLTIKSQIL